MIRTNGEMIWNLSVHDAYRFVLGTRSIIGPDVAGWSKIYLADTQSMRIKSQNWSSYLLGVNPQTKDLAKIELQIFDNKRKSSLLDFSDHLSSFQIWSVRQERGVQKRGAREYIAQIVKEGESLSAIGKVSINSEGQVMLTNCLGLIAGGIPEARQYLKEKIKFLKSHLTPLTWTFLITLGLVGS